MTAHLVQTPATAQVELTVEKSVDNKASVVVKIEPADEATVLAPQAQTSGDELEELQELRVKREDADELAEDDPVKEEPFSEALPCRGNANAPVVAVDPKPKPRSKGFVLEQQHANMLLINQAYFIVFPKIYVFDRHRILCCVDNENRYNEANLKPNPPNAETIFYIENMPYWFDRHNQLWYNLDGQWYPETTYSDLANARVELHRCAEQNRLAAPIAGPSSIVTSPTSTSTSSPPQDSNYDDEYLYPPLSLHPGQTEVDTWFEEFKSRRAALQRTRERLGDIKCPLEQCRKVQRRPQALRDHLYFHFGIKPYKCDYGCSNAFETEANKTRHLDSCAYRQR
ncbi:hypothetical protein FRC07_007405, partial [Ceratobasidium sp. 392]